MEVQVDEAGQDVHAVRVDLVVAGGRAPRCVNGKAGVAYARDPRDAVALDDDVDGAAGRGARAVDDDRAADDEAVEGAVALRAVGSGRHELGGGGGGEQGEDRGGGGECKPCGGGWSRWSASHGAGSGACRSDGRAVGGSCGVAVMSRKSA